VVIIDTAGRLHTQTNLMDELVKVHRVIGKQIPEAPHEILLSIDATTGQNGLRQAKLFKEAVDVSGIVLTKLDGTAKGGIALAIAGELGLPVKLIGIGEALEDLRPFDPDDFARAILEP
jgi:fused signal recognition particle receptor